MRLITEGSTVVIVVEKGDDIRITTEKAIHETCIYVSLTDNKINLEGGGAILNELPE